MAKSAKKSSPVPVVKRSKIKVTEVQNAVARICDCDHVKINIAEASRVIRAHFIALGYMQLTQNISHYQVMEYLVDQLEKGMTEAANHQLTQDHAARICKK